MSPTEIELLQTIRLKGRPTPNDVAAALGVDEAEAPDHIAGLENVEWCKTTGQRVSLTLAGRDRLEVLLDAERTSIDAALISALYGEFEPVNGELKELMTAWQLTGPEEINDHTDPDYDRAVIERMADLHDRFSPLLERVVAAAPRLRRYPHRLATAIERAGSGDHAYVARPMFDSYHTVWFELHEELIGLAGLTRLEEARAGRAS